jgi:hypothetical protein
LLSEKDRKIEQLTNEYNKIVEEFKKSQEEQEKMLEHIVQKLEKSKSDIVPKKEAKEAQKSENDDLKESLTRHIDAKMEETFGQKKPLLSENQTPAKSNMRNSFDERICEAILRAHDIRKQNKKKTPRADPPKVDTLNSDPNEESKTAEAPKRSELSKILGQAKEVKGQKIMKVKEKEVPLDKSNK